MLNGRVHLSTLCLATLAMFDLLSTIVLFGRGFAETNPIFGRLLQYGPMPFILGKLLFTVGPILLLEWVRTKSPKSADQGTWVAFLAYFLMYATHLWSLRGR